MYSDPYFWPRITNDSPEDAQDFICRNVCSHGVSHLGHLSRPTDESRNFVLVDHYGWKATGQGGVNGKPWSALAHGTWRDARERSPAGLTSATRWVSEGPRTTLGTFRVIPISRSRMAPESRLRVRPVLRRRWSGGALRRRSHGRGACPDAARDPICARRGAGRRRCVSRCSEARAWPARSSAWRRNGGVSLLCACPGHP